MASPRHEHTESAHGETDDPPFRLTRGGPAILVAALVLAGVALVVDLPWHRGGEAVTIELVARDVLEGDSNLSFVRTHPEFEPEAKGLCPSLDASRAGVDRLAMVMPPPCELTFAVGDEGPALLDAAAGAP